MPMASELGRRLENFSGFVASSLSERGREVGFALRELFAERGISVYVFIDYE